MLAGKKLKTLCEDHIAKTMFNASKSFLLQKSTKKVKYVRKMDRLALQLSILPACLKTELARRTLKVAVKVSKLEMKNCAALEVSPKLQIIINCLLSVVIQLKPEKLIIGAFFLSGEYPGVVHQALFRSLATMPELKNLELDFLEEWTNDVEQTFVENARFCNLTSFTADKATDKMVSAICRNCVSIETLIVAYSQFITDNCVEDLASCRKLRVADLTETVVSEAGLVRLLLSTQSQLADIGHISNFSKFLHQLETDVVPYRTFPLKKLFYNYKNSDLTLVESDLQLVYKYFPDLVQLGMLHSDHNLPANFSALDPLQNVQKAYLLVCASPAALSHKFLSLESEILTSVRLCSEQSSSKLRVELTSILAIGLRCPNINKLSFAGCSFVETTSEYLCQLRVKPFLKLKKLDVFRCVNASALKVILSHAFFIEKLHIRDDAMNDAFFEYIFLTNPLNELRDLQTYSTNSMSHTMIKFISTNCKKIYKLDMHYQFPSFSAENAQEIQNFKKRINFRFPKSFQQSFSELE